MQVHESHDNTIQERDTGSIVLRPTSNDQWVYFFMILATRRIMNWESFTPSPLSQYAINSVHRLAHRSPRGLDIQYRDQRLFLEAEDGADDDPEDSTYAPSKGEDSDNGDEINDNDTSINPPPDQ